MRPRSALGAKGARRPKATTSLASPSRSWRRSCAGCGRADVRILILNWKDLAHPAAGGAEVFTEQIARELVAHGHTVTLLAASVAGRASREVVGGVEIV